MTPKRIVHNDYIRAGAIDTSTEDLATLANSELMTVRRRVADNERAPQAVLSTLARDKEPEVRMSVALNRSSDPQLLTLLSCDEHADVKYRMASTSYIPKHLLRQLAEDKNPHIANRAKTTLSRLDCKVGRMITVFEFLSEDHALLTTNLKRVLKHFPEWTLAIRFDEATKVMDGIHRHIARQKALCVDWIKCFAPESKTLELLLEKSLADQSKLLEKLTDLSMQHVDGPDFHNGLVHLLERVQEHVHFSENELFIEIKKHLSPEELDAMDLQLNELLLQGRAC
ncbi:MAG TPA: hypothetical protein PL112_19380 [Candidatus Obscuribacter sp.]|nr:hypothetical protein [Candidatus Obscuribacter sp.]MBL8085969.1 hypothetical protein [Candidatus Obscuribacter sp.]HMY03546.1 hypothetical protein [Candidatus Obscuribacter sp.]HMY53345.1 hypothetical protein [Candidatus Obscuribacter sp.]HND68976.1 hypothetical protein [Candidatus Obscuribacter sp.]